METARVYAFEGELCEVGADSGPSYGNWPARKDRKRRQDSGTHALHDTDSRAAFPAIRQGLWKRPAA